MKLNLTVKTILMNLLFGILGFTIVATLGSHLAMQYALDTKVNQLYKEANYISSNYILQYTQKKVTLEDLQKQLDTADIYMDSSVWIIGKGGRILVRSDETELPGDTDVVEAFDPTDFGSSHYAIGDFYHYFPSRTLSVIAPISSDFKISGYVILHTKMSSIEAQGNAILNITYIVFLALWLLSFLFLIFYRIAIYRPLKKVTEGVNHYVKGEYSHRIPVDTNDEVGRLSASLNYMASSMGDADDYQKKFIANISHDFRSPLTSIKGYVEAILDGTIPPEMQEKYLNIVLFETERLNKLTGGLLTLNSFDGKSPILELTTFDIHTVIKNTAAAFEGTCTQKRISIELVLADDKLYVTADKGKIQQVLYNLIDNAIKFSPNNSVIYVETTDKNDKVFISVKDSGIGIPKNSIPKIWERFYKTDLSRGKDKKGTGLGLAITKEIIQAHKENINVISTEGVGSEFIFSLAKAKAPGH